MKDLVMLGQERGLDLKWTWRARKRTAVSFDGLSRSICFSCAVLVVHSDFQLISGITFALPCFLFQFLYFRLSCDGVQCS